MKEARNRGKLELPLIEVDFKSVNENLRSPIQNLTSLDVPHRLADAILRDSELPDGTRFSKSEYAKHWSRSNLWDATAVYELCPTALLFGMWGSPEKPGGLGAKFERAYVSEIVAVDVDRIKKRLGFRIDPLNSSKSVVLKEKGDGTYEVGAGKVRPSELNHGNIPFETDNGGIRCRYAEQVTVVSLGALRKLRFPLNGKEDSAVNDAGRSVLASLGLCAGVLASEMGTSLRSRCHLIPESEREWELIDKPGSTGARFKLDSNKAITLFNQAVESAKRLGHAAKALTASDKGAGRLGPPEPGGCREGERRGRSEMTALGIRYLTGHSVSYDPTRQRPNFRRTPAAFLWPWPLLTSRWAEMLKSGVLSNGWRMRRRRHRCKCPIPPNVPHRGDGGWKPTFPLMISLVVRVS